MIVVDASVAFLWAARDTSDPRARPAQDILTAMLDDGMAAPPIFVYEMANLVHHKYVGQGTPDRRRRTLAPLLQLVRITPQEPADVGAAAERIGLTAYDAAYVALARQLDAPLVTEDAGLHAAGVKELGKDRSMRLEQAVGVWGA